MAPLVETVALGLVAVSLFGRVGAAPASSTFILSGSDSNVNLTFALNVPQPADNDDLFFYLSGPTSNSWLAIGAGAEMRGALMFIAYPGADGNKVILSPRIATGNSEPTYTSGVKVEVLDGSGVSNGILTVKAHCRNCRKWKGGSLDVNSQNQAWIYALGHSDNLKTDSLTVGLRRHEGYGRFNMDMRQATGEGGVPTNFTQNSGAAGNGPGVTDRDLSRQFHALLMCGTFVILFPVGAMFQRLFGSVRLHRLTQLFGLVVILVGLGLGIKLSKQYNKSKKFHSAHQIIGLLVLSLCISQAALGLLQHHLHHRKTQRKSPPAVLNLNLIHRIAGPIIILLGILNGGIGFTFANSPRHNIPYAIIILVVALFFAACIFLKTKWTRRQSKAPVDDHPRAAVGVGEEHAVPGREGQLGDGQHQHQEDGIPLADLPATAAAAAAVPPAYAGAYPPPPAGAGRG
ncbi:MAG: hypothetical protein M1816_001022 [Peltula sp. TS41687]|nr:MAG: hypothetical protein M1816_001022 [Peltula sp. TS41687]